MRRALTTLAFFALLAAVAAIPATARTAAGPSCPAAPSGWQSAPENPTIWGPAQDPGQNSEKVTCIYSNGPKIEQVMSIFALPTDPNPYSDFNYGCTNPIEKAWDSTNRTYIVDSKTVWAYAELDDSNNQIGSGDVNGFEAVTRDLLKLSEPLAHSCKIDTKETSVTSSFNFSFEYASLTKTSTIFGGIASSVPGNPETPSGSFTTETTNKGSSAQERIAAIHAPLIPLTLVQNGKKHTVVLKITKGLSFYIKTPVQTLRAELQVVRSDEPGCKKGTRGTFTFTTHQEFANKGSAKIDMAICGKLFTGGKQVAKGQIINS